MAIKVRNLVGAQTTDPPCEALIGGKLAKRDRILAAFGQADRLHGNSRRVVGRVGLHGATAFQVGSDDPFSGSQIYPLLTAARKAARSKFALTPGCMLRFSALVVPSGMTQKETVEPTLWGPDAAFGQINVRCTFSWTGGSETVVFSRVLPVSQETWGAEATGEGAAWASLRRVHIPLIYPPNVTQVVADLKDFSEGVTCDLAIEYVGGVRCVDAVVQEVPYKYARDVGTDATSTFSMPLSTDGAGEVVKAYPLEYPVEEKSSTDPCYGSLLLADVANRQHTAFGPVLMTATSWVESSQSVTSTEADGRTTSSTTFVNLWDTSLTAWSAAYQGWSLSSGGNAQQFKSSNALRETRDANACVPVRIWVYAHRTTAGTATVRVQSAGYSVAELTLSSATPAWYSVTAHLRCGLGAEDASTMQVLGKISDGSGTLHVRAVVVEYLDT